MKNLVNSRRTYEIKIERTFKEGNLISENETEFYNESEWFEQIPSTGLQNSSNSYKLFYILINLILKSEGLISFYFYLKEPAFTNFLTLTARNIRKFLNV